MKTKPKAHVSDDKKKAVKELVKLFKSYPNIGIVDVEGLPSSSLQKMRSQLKGKALIKSIKTRLIRLALEEAKEQVKGLEGLSKYVKGMPALIFTNENPFKLYKFIEKSKSMAPIKPGQKAPMDLTINAGPTPFAPGPILSELSSLGLKAGIEAGKVAIKQDKVIAKEGDVVDGKVAALLAKLGIEPMEICLNVVAILENGLVLVKDVLSVDETVYIANIKMLHNEALALAMKIGYISKDTVRPMIQKAERESKAIASAKNIEHK